MSEYVWASMQEDAQERAVFDERARDAIINSLRIGANALPQQGTMAKMFAIMANEVAKLHSDPVDPDDNARDAAMLQRMQFHGAHVAWGNDHKLCSVRWSDRDGQYRTDNYSDWREAIVNTMRGNFKEQL